MTFLNPLTAIIAAAIAVPSLLILYFLKLRRREVEISTTLLWRQAIEDLQANAPFQKLRNNILLILQMIALTALLLALAQPQIKALISGGARLVILIDRSASMQATDGIAEKPGEATRLDIAKREAHKLVDALAEPGFFGGGGDQAMVIAFDTSALVMQTFTSSKQQLRGAIDRISATDAPGRFEDAFKLAKANARPPLMQEAAEKDVDGSRIAGEPGVIHLFSDGRLPDASKVSPEKEDLIVFHSTGAGSTENIAIVSLRAERSYDKPGMLSVFVAVQSTARTAQSIDVTLSLDGQVAAVKSVTLPAASLPPVAEGASVADVSVIPSTNGLIFSVDRPTSAIVSISIKGPAPDALAADDVGYLVVPPARRLAVAVVTPGNLFLREVLDGMSFSRNPLYLAPAEGQAFLDDPKRFGEYDVVILDRWLPTVKQADGKAGPGLPPGRFMVFGPPPPPPLGLIDGGPAEATVALDVSRTHPVMRPLSLDSLVVNPARKTSLAERTPVTVLASGAEGPLIVEAADVDTRALIAFDITQSTWPFDPSFVLYIAGGLRHLSGSGADPAAAPIRAGATLTERLPAGATSATIALPDRRSIDLVQESGGQVTFGPLQQIGIYTLSWSGPLGGTDVEVGGRARRAAAVNLLDTEESDIGARKELTLASKAVTALGGEMPGSRRLWPYLLLVCLLVVMFEWYIYNRKVAI